MNRCGGCCVGSDDRVLFYLPAAWAGGLCLDCAANGAATAEAFRAHFGAEVRHVSDGDSGKGQQKS